MRIYKDILDELSMNSMYLIWKGQNFFCTPLDISGNVWTVAVDADFTVEGICELIVNYKDKRLVFPCHIGTVDTGAIIISSCIHRCILSTSVSGDDEIEFQKRVREIESQQYKWNKRKEERYDIKFDIEAIQFSSPQQQVILPQETLPCFIDNISFGGAKIITYESRYEVGNKVVVSYTFSNPIEVIQVPSYIRHIISLPKKEDSERLIALCLEYDHAPLAFQKRLTVFVERLNAIKNTKGVNSI